MNTRVHLYIGTSGWSYDHWVERFYPRELKKNEWFPYFSERFASVELNMSFYRYPSVKMLEGWKAKMPAGFRMTFKANRRITHYKKFQGVEREVGRFYDLFEVLGEKAGCILFQIPASFPCNDRNVAVLQSFMELLDGSHRNVFEFRHASWWNRQTAELLRRRNAAFCTVSGLDMPPDSVTTADFAYFRFHGPAQAYESKYSERQLADWAETIRGEVEAHGLGEVYCYFNNDCCAYAVDNALTLRRMIGEPAS